MRADRDRLSEEAARAIWRRAAQLQAEAEHRLEESQRLPAEAVSEGGDAETLPREDIRVAAEEAGISPEFVQIAMAEAAAAATGPSSEMGPADELGARLFLGASRKTIQLARTVPGSVESVSAAVLQVFAGHPLLLQAGEIADLPSWSGRVIVFNVPRYDWSASANPPFVEKAAAIGLKQMHVAVRPLPGEVPNCEVVVAADLQPGMRKYWRWSAATSLGATAVGGAAGVGFGATMMAGAILIVPGLVGAAVLSGASIGGWVWGHRWYLKAVEESLEESLQLLPAAVRTGEAARRPLLP